MHLSAEWITDCNATSPFPLWPNRTGCLGKGSFGLWNQIANCQNVTLKAGNAVSTAGCDFHYLVDSLLASFQVHILKTNNENLPAGDSLEEVMLFGCHHALAYHVPVREMSDSLSAH